MMGKYLYGKYKNLEKFIRGRAHLRFTDIYYFKELENELIRDDESKRTYLHTPSNIGLLKIGDHEIKTSDIRKLEFSLPTRRAHVLCLSNKGNSPELFGRFKADICIEIDVGFLIEIIKTGFSNIGAPVEVVGNDVEYFKIDSKAMTTDSTKLVFCKNFESFHIEEEYRIAIFYPGNANSAFLDSKGNKVRIFGEYNYIEIGSSEENDMKKTIVSTIRSDGTLITL
jgi:hypothetical protein